MKSRATLSTLCVIAVSLLYATSCGGGGGGQKSTPPPTQNPVPAVAALSPTSATAGDAAFTLAVTGTGFITKSTVHWNGQDRTTTFKNNTQIEAAISASDIAAAGTAQVTVFNPSPGGGTSAAMTFTMTAAPANPVPRAFSVNPASTSAGAPAFTLTVNGTDFVSTSTVRWNGQGRTTTFVSATRLQASIPASDIASPAIDLVTVFSPPPGGGNSVGMPFTIVGPGGPISLILQSIAAPWLEPGAMAAANFGGDPTPDIAVTDLFPVNVHLGFGDGAGAFSFGPDLLLQAKNVTTADFNGDGRVDLAFTTLPLDSALNEVAVFLGNGQGGFTQSWRYAYPLSSPCKQGLGELRAVTAAELNDDGKTDLVVGHAGFSVFLGNGDGTFVQPTNVGCNPSVNSEATSVATADFNLDGNTDVAVVDALLNQLTVWLNNGSGNFSAQAPLAHPGGTFGGSLVAVDFDLDGRPDLAAKASPRAVFVYFGNGDGTFAGPVGVVSAAMDPSGFTQSVLSGADLNRDNIPDLIFTGPADQILFPGAHTTVDVFLNNGHRGFVISGGAVIDAGVGGIAAFDVDGDGRRDLVMAASDEVLELLNK